MKNKLKILMGVGVLVGQLTSSGGVLAAGAEINSIPIPMAEHGPELYIKRIDPGNNKIALYYLDSGGRGQGKFTNLNVAWPRETGFLLEQRPELGEDYVFDFDALALDLGYANHWWSGVHFNNRTLLPISGQEVEVPAQWPDRYSLKDSPYNTLYFSTQITDGSEKNYWLGKADYGDCMRAWEEGVICEAKIEDDGAVKYLPYLNGNLLEIPPREDNTGTNNTSTDETKPGDDNAGNNDNSADDEDSENNEQSNDSKQSSGNELLNNNEQLSNEMSNKIAEMPVLLAGVGSAVIDSGSDGGAKANSQRSAPDISDESDESPEESEDNAIEGAVVTGLSEEENDIVVPELGGKEEDNFWLLILGVFAAASIALMSYWWIILPLVKRKKDEEEKQE